jgi:hypothetical protein
VDIILWILYLFLVSPSNKVAMRMEKAMEKAKAKAKENEPNRTLPSKQSVVSLSRLGLVGPLALPCLRGCCKRL